MSRKRMNRLRLQVLKACQRMNADRELLRQAKAAARRLTRSKP